MPRSRASSAKMVAAFSPMSIFRRLITSFFLPRSASWPALLFLSCSTLISSRRVDIANSARNWSLSAWISAIETGVAASSRRTVRRTARPCTNGTMISPIRAAARKPRPKYMIGSIMNASGPIRVGPCHNAMRGVPTPARGWVNLNRRTGQENDARRARRSEWIPGRVRGEFEIAHIGAEAQADAGTDRDHHDAARGERRHADAADEVGRAVDPGKALIDRLGGRQAVDQHHGPGAFAADIPAQRRALPVHPQVTRVLGVEGAFAIAKSANESAAALLTEDVAVRLPPGGEGALDHAGEAARDAAEEFMAGVEDFIRRIAFGGLRACRRRRQRDEQGQQKGISKGSH